MSLTTEFMSYICKSQQKQTILDYFSGVTLEILQLTTKNIKWLNDIFALHKCYKTI